MSQAFKKVLVANRGEIAMRIFRACHDLGLQTIAIYSNEDVYSLFRTAADESYLIGENESPLGAIWTSPGSSSWLRSTAPMPFTPVMVSSVRTRILPGPARLRASSSSAPPPRFWT